MYKQSITQPLKKEGIVASVTTWVDPEGTMLDQTQIPHALTYMWNLKTKQNPSLQIQRTA